MSSVNLKQEVKSISAFEYLDYRLFLDALYHQIKKSGQRYSYIQFSEDLGFSKTNVIHLIIKGKRPLSVKASEKASQALGLTNLDKKYFSTLVKYQNARQGELRESLFKELIALKSKVLSAPESQHQLEFFSEWYHIIIYQMTFMDDFNPDPKDIARNVSPNIRPDQARKSLHLLNTLNLIHFDEERQKYGPTNTRISTGDEIASIAVTRYHQKMIDLAKESITKVTDSERDISSVSISIPHDMIPQLKEEISLFRKRILALADQKRMQCDEVYQMNVQLFPTTKIRKKGGQS